MNLLQLLSAKAGDFQSNRIGPDIDCGERRHGGREVVYSFGNEFWSKEKRLLSAVPFIMKRRNQS
jgi:hypothetical protein